MSKQEYHKYYDNLYDQFSKDPHYKNDNTDDFQLNNVI